MQALVQELLRKGYGDKAVANALVAARSGQELWHYIDSLGEGVQRAYWIRMNPYFHGLRDEELIEGIDKLLQYRRFNLAIRVAWCHRTRVPSDMLTDILRRWWTENSQKSRSQADGQIKGIFKELNERADIDKETYLELEALYLPLLIRAGAQVGVPHLEAELASNPDSFVQLLKWLYSPKNKDQQRKEQKGLSKEQILNAATRSRLMLEAWKKIPGMQEDSTIDGIKLREWIDEARTLARECGRLEVADSRIGQLLAKYPERSLHWPERTIFQVIEDINTEKLKTGYSIGMWNKQGVTVRGPFDGGTIERERVEYFAQLASEVMCDYPNVSEIFSELQGDYERYERKYDEEAERAKLDS